MKTDKQIYEELKRKVENDLNNEKEKLNILKEELYESKILRDLVGIASNEYINNLSRDQKDIHKDIEVQEKKIEEIRETLGFIKLDAKKDL